VAQRWIDRMGISLDRAADVPVGIQLAWALGGAIRSGSLVPGERLPPLRELAD
jgi:DNA-binding transcriptional regulator YhcF (GntR family)